MSTYYKFLKNILSSKRKLKNYGTVALTGECSVLIHKKLLPKLKDSGSFLIPCIISDINFDKNLCDFGAM